MKLNKISVLSLAMMSVAFTACNNDDDNAVATENIKVLEYQIPTTYEFSRENASTVDVADQKSRILMLNEIGTYITSGKEAPLSSDKLTQMYANTNAQFTTPGLPEVGSSINLQDKTATSREYFNGGNAETTIVQGSFVSAFTSAVEASQTGAVAAPGVAGKNGTRLYAKNGIEPGQLIAKGMMGAHLMDQVLNNFLSKSVLDAGKNRINNANKVLVEGENYTEMEHAWDQAYGYIYGGGLNASNKTYFWESYIGQVAQQGPAFASLEAAIKNAFIKGRAAITGNDYKVRDEQIAIIKEAFSKIPAVRGVHYLQEGKGKLASANRTDSFHALSEGYGFIMDLRYTNNPATNKPYFTKEEVDEMLSKLSTGTQENPGLWDVDNIGAKLDEISEQIANKFGFSVSDAAAG